MDHRDFFKELFEDKPTDSKIAVSIFPMQKQKAKFFDSYEDAADFVEKHLQSDKNIYTSGGLLKNDITRVGVFTYYVTMSFLNTDFSSSIWT